MENKSNKDAIIIILLIVLLLAVIGGLVWYYISQNNTNKVEIPQNNNEQTLIAKDAEINSLKGEVESKITQINSLKGEVEAKDKEITSLKNENEQLKKSNTDKMKNVVIEEAVNYTYNKLKVRLPKIVNGGANAQALNKKILNKALEATYSRAEHDGTLDYGKDGYTVKYDYCTKNNIIAIYVSITENSGAEYPATGDGIVRFNYFYDIKNDKELSFDAGVKQMGVNEYVIDNFLMGKLLLIENGKFLKEYKAI